MKPLLKRTLIIGSCILIPTTLIGAGAGLYFGSQSIERISKKGIYVAKINEVLNNEGYKFDYSASYGSIVASSKPSILLTNEILHLRSEGNFKYDAVNKQVLQPSFESYEFGIANGIVLTFVDKSVTKEQVNTNNIPQDKYFQLVFDNDDAEVFPSDQELQDKTKIVFNKTSKNPRSINNPDVFGKISSMGYLKNKIDLNDPNLNIDTSEKNFVLAGIGIIFNGDSKWVDSNGNATKYNIVAEDMFYSIKRTWLFDKKYRLSHGGSNELDRYFIEKTQTTKIFGDSQKYPNEYLFDFFGVIKEDLYIKEKAIQKVNPGSNEEKEAFTFAMDIFEPNGSINTNTTFSIADIIKKYLVNSITFSLAPSQYIKEKLASNNELNKTKAGEITGEAREFGIYTYAQKRDQTLFAANYIPVSSKAGREIYEYNKYYANKKWVESVEKGIEVKDSNGQTKIQRSLNKIILTYTGGIDTATFANQSFKSFMTGTLSELEYSSLTNSQKRELYGTSENPQELLQNAAYNGLRATKKINTSSLTSRTVWQANPINNATDYTFNDHYAKLIYGASKEELKSGKATTASTFFSGTGFHFRNLIQASINWDYYIEWAYSKTRDAWLSGAAQDAIFSSINPSGSLKPIDFNLEGINDLFYFDENGNKQTITLKELKELTLNPPSSGDQTATQSKAPKKHYEAIQKSMKKLLDEFYTQNNINSSEKIIWHIPYSFADQDETKVEATKFIVEKVIGEIDPRLQPKFVKPTKRDELLDEINKKKGAFNANLWSYDYEGIGSYFAAFFSEGGGTNLLGAVSIFSQDDVSTNTNAVQLQKMFPRFSELAKFIKTEINQAFDANGKTADSMYKVENWDKINNQNMNSIVSFFKDPIKNPNNVNPISLIPVILKRFEAEASWEKNGTTPKEKGQGWAELIKEFSSIKGVSIDTETSVSKLTNINYVLFLREYIVPISSSGINLFSNFKYEVNK